MLHPGYRMFLIGIAGGSGSGKTTFARKIVDGVAHPDVAMVHQDSYYLPSLPLHLISADLKKNYDHPDAFDWELLASHLAILKSGGAVDVPVYDFKTSSRTSQTERIGPCKTLLVEGLYTLLKSETRSLFDLKVFLHVEADIRFIRRLHRDVRERGRTLDSVIHQYYDTVRPMHLSHIEPTQQFADIIVSEETDIAAQVIAASVKERIR